ncbi:PHF5-like protein [Metschnikowia bicuspidata var. bicuspidata NRRL YB-4993]|uniref:PHF5-like protein n=1 Tax=Metschnikowia bicuspidata var. bicuspidata NRRL YB-4993 TaxID=869754 RepID=A0A1A0HIX6_9ASCO|nr:PHF5-like protein [Metschnikowia bicuspidata var. bicuspidata NRRL YB-4993]OBA23837.1 PHF5-like protein [Metschnikowia bicuspidata var. bicuspidata NRRL YB-4993]
MSRHQFDLVQCMKRPGTHFGFLCLQCDGKCPICDSLVKPSAKAQVCDGCSFGHLALRCILCGNHFGEGPDRGSPAYYCHECVVQEKHRDGCPRIVNVGSSKADQRLNKKTKALT